MRDSGRGRRCRFDPRLHAQWCVRARGLRDPEALRCLRAPGGLPFPLHPGDRDHEANGIQELLANAAALGAPAIACRFNNPGYNLVHELLERMRERGMNVWGELYPYIAGSTALNAVFLTKETWVDQLGYKCEETLQDALTGAFYTTRRARR